VVDLAKRTPGLSTASMASLNDLSLLIGQLPAIRKLVLSSTDDDADAVERLHQRDHLRAEPRPGVGGPARRPSLAGPATALLDLGGAREQLRLQQAFVLVGIGRGHLVDAEAKMVAAAETRYQDRIANFQASRPRSGSSSSSRPWPASTSAPAAVAAVRGVPANRAASRIEQEDPAAGHLADEWNKTSDATVGLVLKVENGLTPSCTTPRRASRRTPATGPDSSRSCWW